MELKKNIADSGSACGSTCTGPFDCPSGGLHWLRYIRLKCKIMSTVTVKNKSRLIYLNWSAFFKYLLMILKRLVLFCGVYWIPISVIFCQKQPFSILGMIKEPASGIESNTFFLDPGLQTLNIKINTIWTLLIKVDDHRVFFGRVKVFRFVNQACCFFAIVSFPFEEFGGTP